MWFDYDKKKRRFEGGNKFSVHKLRNLNIVDVFLQNLQISLILLKARICFLSETQNTQVH